jgi:hypothetical protein
MSLDKNINPRADMLMGSMRSMGYSFEAAVADVIDNSITAQCTYVKIFLPTNPLDEQAVGILDDGIGMSKDTLIEAMRYGSAAPEDARRENDLGRFGLGLKSASLSQCKILTVISIYNRKTAAYSWDYDYILQKKSWVAKELNSSEIKSLPYYQALKEQGKGTMVLWQNFDILHKFSEGLVYDTLNDQKEKLDQYLGLIFHRYLSATKNKLSFYINNHKIKPQDPFLESHPKTTTKKERTIAIRDTSNIERKIYIKPFILPFATDLSEKDKKLIGGVENLRLRQGFYIYRNNRLIIWGTWFGMKPRAELTKNARIRVDIPNSLDDIWSIDIKKQTASIPKRIKQQLKNTVIQALEISTTKQTHRGRKENVDDDKDYIWERYEDRNKAFYYQVNRDSKLFKFIRSQMTDSDFDLMQMFLGEIEKNLPIQQMYIDKSNEKIVIEEPDSRINDVVEMGITLCCNIHDITNRPYVDIISDIMNSEPFCNYESIKSTLIENFSHDAQ